LENLKKGAAAEHVDIPTLVCAYNLGLMHEADALTPDPHIARYPVVKQVAIKDGVPIMRVEDLVVKPELHVGTQVLRQVHIQVLSKLVEIDRVRQEYDQLLADHGAHWARNHSGRFSYEGLLGTLQITVEAGPGWELTPRDVEGMGDPLRHSAWHFPAPSLVARMYDAILGPKKGDDKGGFARALDQYGKGNQKETENIVPAFLAWCWGSKAAPNAGEEVGTDARPRVARLLNRHLLDDCDSVQRMPEEGWQCTGDHVWSDVKVLWPRFVRLQALLK
jgi:hypothetical protein